MPEHYDHLFAADRSISDGEKVCYSGEKLDRFRKLYRFEMKSYKGELEDVTDDIQELWEQGGRGFYSAILSKTGPREVCCFNIPNEVHMIRR